MRRFVRRSATRGLAVILVTGRRLVDLRTSAGDLSCFDVVVAENGAVLEFPRNAQHVLLAHSPQPAFLDELRRRRIDFIQGESVIEADAASATAMLEVIRALEQPLVLAFNRGRVMVLPQAVAKSTGLRRALHTLRLSIHNTVGIGDAKNDHDLLDACEVGVAVEWGSSALRAVADEVIRGVGPPAVAEYMLGDAAEEETTHASPAVRSDDDEVWMPLLGGCEDRLAGGSLTHVGRGLKPRGLQLRGDLVDEESPALHHVAARFENVSRRRRPFGEPQIGRQPPCAIPPSASPAPRSARDETV